MPGKKVKIKDFQNRAEYNRQKFYSTKETYYLNRWIAWQTRAQRLSRELTQRQKEYENGKN